MTTFFRNLKTGHKLALGFGFCILLGVAVGSIAITRLTQATNVSKNIISGSLGGVESLAQFNESVRRFRIAEFQHLLATKKADKDDLEKEMAGEKSDAQTALQGYESALSDPIDRQNYDLLKANWDKYAAMNDGFLSVSRANRTNQGSDLLNGPMDDQFATVTAQRRVMAEWNQHHGEWYARQTESTYRSGVAVILGLLALLVLAGTAVSVLITRYMTGALSQVSGRIGSLNTVCLANLAHAVEALEHGDLTTQIVTGTEPLNFQSNDELGQMAQTFNEMIAKVHATASSFRASQASLSTLVREMQQSASQVDSAAQTLSGTSQQIGAATEEIGATMHEVAQASEQSARGASEVAQGSGLQAASIATGAEQVKELVAAIQAVTKDAEAASQSAELANQTAADGAEAVGKTVAGMERIHDAVAESASVIQSLGQTSAKIGGIVQTINEIAGQTNLLALNAAIEAARAGEAGRGFAVVADEVRKLAERCTLATKDIGTLISEIQGQTQQAVSAMASGTSEVKSGTSLAGDAGAALARIQSVVSEMSSRVLSISVASEEMAASAQEVSATINEVAAVVEESSAAAEEMSASAEQVSASVQTVAGTTAQQGAAVDDLVASASELAGVSQSLSALVSQFRVAEESLASLTSASRSSKPQLSLRKVA